MKEIKDYLPFYLGCQAKVIFARNEAAPEIGELIEVGKNMAFVENDKHEYYECMPYEVKPILRPLCDMTGEELIQYGKIEVPEMNVRFDLKGIREVAMHAYYEPETFRWLLSKSFDLFGLIEAGLAIDKTKINNHGI